MMRKQKGLLEASAIALVAIGLAGCYSTPDVDTTAPSAKVVQAYTPKAPAGLPVTVGTDVNAIKPLIARAARFGSRSNPFLLLEDEVRFEQSQEAARLFQDLGSFDVFYEPPVPTSNPPVLEAQPYRRLSGIVIGDAVVGILETQGEPTIIIVPGQLIPNTDWRVVSINEERAILRRSGNRLPREITVRLESPPPGFSQAGIGGGAEGGPSGPPGSGSGSRPGSMGDGEGR